MKNKVVENDHVSVACDENQFRVTINSPVSFTILNIGLNRKLLVVLLRLLVGLDGKNVLTFQQIANLLGYRDRRDANNYWREFQACNCNILDFLSRKVELLRYFALIEKFVLQNLLLPLNLMYAQFTALHMVKMSYPTFCKYVGQIDATAVVKQAHELIRDNATGGDTVNLLRVLAGQHNVPVICDQLLEYAKAVSPKRKQANATSDPLNMLRQNRCLLVHYLMGKGMNQNTIAMLLNISRATVSNLWHEIVDLQSIILNSIAMWSGKISIDEKFIRIQGVP